jgi:phytoene dehydrogenase-like protein
MSDVDAVVIGSGPNGLVAANLLADAGWDVLVLEAQPTPGGAVRTAELTVPGFRHDVFSAFYPLAAASSYISGLELEDHGLRWCRAPKVLAHPFADGRCAVLSTDLEETVASVDSYARGDGDGWRRLVDRWRQLTPALLDGLFRPFPPVGPAARLAGRLRGVHELLDFVRFTLLPVRRLADEEFTGEGAPMLLAGNTLHTDLTPDSAIGGFFAWMLCMLGQHHGFPVPEGGAGELIAAMMRRLEKRGGRVECSAPVTRIEVRRGRAVGVRTADGREIGVRRAVIADVVAPALYHDLVGPEHLPSSLLHDLRRFQFDNATVKVDWALSAPVPWVADAARQAGTVHIGDGMDHLTRYTGELSMGLIPTRPFLLFGQMTTADPTRSPAGTETAWAYTHVPFTTKGDAGGALTGAWDEAETEAFAERMEAEIEALAPGFRDLVLQRHVLSPVGIQAANASLVSGAVNQGTAQLHQQLVFRPTPGFGRPETPIAGLYLGSASAHPGGGVHGACGGNAATVAIRRDRARRLLPVGVATGAMGVALSRRAGSGRR